MFSFASGLLVGFLLGIVGTLLLLLAMSAVPDEFPVPASVSKSWVFTVLILVLMVLSGYIFDWLNLRRAAFVTLTLLLLVLGTAKFKGLIASWLALVLAALVLSYILPPAGTVKIAGTDDQILLVFFLICALIGTRFLSRGQRA